MNKNVVAKIIHNKYKDVLLSKKCIRHSLNKIKIKIYTIRTNEINKISLSCFDNKIYIQNNGYED